MEVTSMTHRVTLIPGDGIGPEISSAVLRIIEATGVEIEWESFVVGEQAQESLGSSLPDDVIQSIRRNGVALKGPVATAMGTGFESITVR
ncbi:MAG TPA: isocitrate/isopropylmalate family dehydrogenase, partial [Syntrophales bacterium]|nr:isocitrate/isopropylmalate family dehydrogenase [Syntrophales bacterium]